MRDDLLTLPAALAAAALLDNPELSTAEREAALEAVRAAAGTVRELTAWLDQEATDRLAWALRVHGGLSQDQVARVLGYGTEGKRSVSTVQLRLAREQARRIGDTALSLVIAAQTGPASRITVLAPPKADPAAFAAALAEVHAAAETEAQQQGGPTERTAAALEALAKAAGPAAGRVLARLGDDAFRASNNGNPPLYQP